MDQSESFPEMYVKLLEREARRRLLEWGQILSSLRLGEKSSDLFSKTEAISNFQQSSLIFILYPLELNPVINEA